jgi:hypothetical protein
MASRVGMQISNGDFSMPGEIRRRLWKCECLKIDRSAITRAHFHALECSPCWPPIVSNIHGLIGRRKLLRRVPGLQGFPSDFKIGLGRVEVPSLAHREAAGKVEVDFPQPDGRHAFVG